MECSPSPVLDDAEKRRRVAEDPDYILLKRFDYSLQRLLVRYQDGVPSNVIAAALGISESEAERRYQKIVFVLRDMLDVE